MKPARRKYKKVSKPGSKLSSFFKREMFKHLIKNGCSEESVDEVLHRFNTSKPITIAYFNELIDEAEKFLHQECSSLCFDNIEAWLAVMKLNNLTVPTEAFAEYLAEIAQVETLPKPEELNGINMRDIYNFLSNAMLGLPQSALNADSAEFLAKEMESLIEEINNETGDEVVYAMFDKLRTFPLPDHNFDVLDPFGLKTLT